MSEASSTIVPAREPSAVAPSLSLAMIAVGIALVAIDLRPGIVSIGPILPRIRDEFGLTHAAASLLTTIPDLLMGLLALPTPWLARRIGRDNLMFGALGLLLIASLARAFVPSTALLLLTTAGVGTGIAVSGTLVGGFIKARFPAKAAFLIGIYASALSLGSMISAAASGPLSSYAGGWRMGAGVWSPLGIVAIAAWAFLARRDRAAGAVHTSGKKVSLPIANGTAWRVALFFGAQNFLFYSCIAWIAPLFREHGFSASRAGLVLASFTAAFFLSNPVFSNISRSEDRRVPLAVASITVIAGLLLWALAGDSLPFLAIPLTAIGLGGAFTLGMTLPLDNTHEATEADAWNAFVLTVGYLIAAAGPLTMGILRDRTGSFVASLGFLVVVGIAMLLLVPFLKPAHLKSLG